MSKCVFCKKHRTLKGYYRCEVTNQIKGYRCYNDNYWFRKKDCKYFKASLIDQFFEWLEDRFY